MIGDYIKIAYRNLKRRKMRSWLTMIGIFISIMTIFVLVSASLGLSSAVEEQFRLLGTDKIFIQPRGQLAGPGTGGAVELTESDVDAIDRISGVKQTTYWIANSAEIEFANQKRYFFGVGFPLDESNIFVEGGSYKIDEGKYLGSGDFGRVMIGSQYKYNNVFKRPVSVGDKLLVNGEEFKVIGILESVGNPQDDKNVYMSEKDFRRIFDVGDRIDMIMAQVESQEDIKEIAKKIEKKLFTIRNVDEESRDFSILTPDELLESFGNILNIITAFLLSVAAISLLVGGIGIANTMYTSVLERTKEIGVMKAIGARNRDIASIFVIESGLLGLAGGIIGVFFGFIVSKTLEYIAINQIGTTLLRAATPTYLFVGCLAFAFLSGAVSGAWPSWRASKIRPADALRYE